MEASATTSHAEYVFSKVPQVAVAFWIVTILATTLGGTGGGSSS